MVSNIEFVLRLLISVALGAAIGLEREKKNQSAGLRTHIVVILGATLVMLISIYGFTSVNIATKDPARLAAQVVSGIGFLGAGTIIVNKNKIRGLTTAASLWTTACIGLAVGAGMYIPATAATVILLITLSIVQYFEHRHLKREYKRLTVTVSDVHSFMDGLDDILSDDGIILAKVEKKEPYEDPESGETLTMLDIYLQLPAYADASFLVGDLGRIKEIRKIEDIKSEKR